MARVYHVRLSWRRYASVARAHAGRPRRVRGARVQRACRAEGRAGQAGLMLCRCFSDTVMPAWGVGGMRELGVASA